MMSGDVRGGACDERVERGEGPERWAPVPRYASASLGDVAGLRTLRAVDDFELDRLTLFECPETSALNRGEVHEHVVAPFAFDETITFSVVEPLDLARNTHRTCLPCEIGDGESAALEKKDRTCGLYFDDGPAQRRSVILVGHLGRVKSYPINSEL